MSDASESQTAISPCPRQAAPATSRVGRVFSCFSISDSVSRASVSEVVINPTRVWMSCSACASRSAATNAASPASAPAPAHQTLDEMKALDADSRAIEENRSRRDRSTQEAVRPEEPKKTEEQLKAEAEQAETALKLGTRSRSRLHAKRTHKCRRNDSRVPARRR